MAQYVDIEIRGMSCASCVGVWSAHSASSQA